ncbi:chloride channel protein [Pseudonocardia saturnea]
MVRGAGPGAGRAAVRAAGAPVRPRGARPRGARGHARVARNGSRIPPRVAAVKSLASALCIGSGGSVGREGTIVQIGAAPGSSMGRWPRVTPHRLGLLVACGAAGGISATFNAPVAGVFFAFELVLRSFSAEAFGVVVIASVTASVVGRTVMGDEPFLDLPPFSVGRWGPSPSRWTRKRSARDHRPTRAGPLRRPFRSGTVVTTSARSSRRTHCRGPGRMSGPPIWRARCRRCTPERRRTTPCPPCTTRDDRPVRRRTRGPGPDRLGGPPRPGRRLRHRSTGSQRSAAINPPG